MSDQPDQLPQSNRTRKAFAEPGAGDPNARLMRQCKAAARTLLEQAEEKARFETKKQGAPVAPEATKTAEDLYAEAMEAISGKPKPTTLEEALAAGYSPEDAQALVDMETERLQPDGEQPQNNG